MSTRSVTGTSTAPVVRQLLNEVARESLRVAAIVLLLVGLAVGGWWAGEIFAARTGAEYLPWVGGVAGVALWLAGRPRRRNKRSGANSSGQISVYHGEPYLDDGAWFDSGPDD